MQADDGTLEPKIKWDTSEFVFEMSWQWLNFMQREQMRTTMQSINPGDDNSWLKTYNLLCVYIYVCKLIIFMTHFISL
jgi:hypothetical protein